MKFGTALYFSAVILAAFFMPGDASARGGRLAPRDFNKMYYLASRGKVGFLRDAVNRGLNIDAVNLNGDTGLCIAVKRNDRVAYNSFRMSGANPHHACTYRMLKEYRAFLESSRVADTQRVIGNEESLYYDEEEKSWWPWILGGAVIGGVALALSSSGGGGSSYVATDDPTIVPTSSGYGLGSVIANANKEVTTGTETNDIARQIINANASDYVDQIQLLSNVLSNSDYLLSYVSVSDGASFDNLEEGSLYLYDATVGINVTGESSTGYNHGVIQIEAENGAIGLVASNGAEIINGQATTDDTESDSSDGRINITFKGNSEGDVVIGMYGDTNSTVINYGQIKGTSTQASVSTSDDDSSTVLVDEDSDDEEDEETETGNNSGTILGMVLFDLYTGTNLSANTVTAENYGTIELSAGYNSATDVAVSLIGMGSYIDDNFLNGNNDPSYAEKMVLNNYGDISLSYQGSFNLDDTALKLGQGGLIGIRADAATEALNQGNININLAGATMDTGTDVAAGMLSVHGGMLTNDSSGVIRVINEATSGGVSYGMLAAKGEGSQTRVYDWSDPVLLNYGLIDMQASNAYGMASFAGGDVINYGVINLGVENGQSYYSGNYGLYAAGEDLTEEVLLQNKGIINVYSEESVAIYNAFSGSVEMINDGTIYLSSKATNSQVFGGNFSSAYNNGSILYKVGNSDSFSIPTGSKDDVGYNTSASVVAAAVTVSSDDNTTKQLFVNNGEMIIGDQYGETVNYGGTYGTAAVQVSKQGAADNYGTITLEQFDVDYSQFNVGMWLDSTATAEAYVNNYGDIIVEATNSIGIRNDSSNGGSATNFGNIYVNGQYGYGMAVTSSQGMIFNGRSSSSADSDNMIYVSGQGSAGMYVGNGGTAYNYGSIYLQGDNTVGVILDGDGSSLAVLGNIYHDSDYSGIIYLETANGADYTFDFSDDVEIEGYTLGKAIDGGILGFSTGSTAYVQGVDSYLFQGTGSGSQISNSGMVYASSGATVLTVDDGASASNDGTIELSGDSVGLAASGSGTTATNSGSILVEGGTGLSASGYASIVNNGVITVTDGIGMLVKDRSDSENSTGTNTYLIEVSGQGNIGVKVDNASFTNSGTITVSCEDDDCSDDGQYAYGIYFASGTGTVQNTGEITVGENSIGMYGGENAGTIYTNADTSYGIVEGVNSGSISGRYGVGGYNSDNSGDIAITNGTGLYVSSSGSVTNSGTVSVSSGDGVIVDGGSFSNEGSISVITGNGVKVINSGYGVNTGTITISGSGYGVLVESGSFQNNGTISYNSSAGGSCSSGSVYTGDGGSCEDQAEDTTETTDTTDTTTDTTETTDTTTDTTTESTETTTDTTAVANSVLIYVGENGTFLNSGVVEAVGEVLDFDAMRDETGTFAIASGGTYKADAFKGSVVASSDIVKGGFEDLYVNENSFVGRDEGLSIVSGSYMFDASLNDNGDSIDVEMYRKSFLELMDNEEIANFLETNYKLQNNEAMYNALKDAMDKETFDETTKTETGQNFYANLPRENMAVLRGLNAQEQRRILEEGLDGGYIGADYFRVGKDEHGDLSGFSDSVYSPYIGYGAKLGDGWSIGATLRGAYADAEYDEASSSRDNKILMMFIPILYKNNGFQFLTMPSFGAGYGTYKRHAVSGIYEADTFDLYYGLYNHADYSIDMKVVELVAEAELNLQSSSMSKMEEEGGLNLQSNDSVSLEVGVGLKLRKRIQLAKERSLMLALGTKYYHEFLDPYKDLRVGMDGSPLDFGIEAYNEDKNRFKTTVEAVYKEGDFAVAAEVSHNAESESSIEGGIGVRYNF